jgi:hypothetical protein
MSIPTRTTLGAPYTPDVTASTPESHENATDESWGLTRLAGFRFLVAYVLLYALPFPLNELPYLNRTGAWIHAFWMAIVPWTATHIIHLSHPLNVQPSGSGDRTFDWIQVFCTLALAIIAAGVWTAIDRKRRAFPRLAAALWVYMRLYLALVLYSYAFDKIFPNQFSHLDPVKLTHYIGESSPGGYAWLFLGLSIPYEIFAGCCEALAATLLLFRRTKTLGALVGVGVMTNVFMLNMNFDIPVKQFSFHLLAFLAVLAAGDARRVANLFLFDRATQPAPARSMFTSRTWARRAAIVTALCMVWLVYRDVRGEWQVYHEFGIGRPLPRLAGIFEVDEVAKNGVVAPGLVTDSTRWRRFAFNGFSAAVRLASDGLETFGLQVDSTKRTLTFRRSMPDSLIGTPAMGTWKSTPEVFAYEMPDAEHLVMHGRMGADSVDMRLHRRPESSYLLVSHGMFHLVNEVPYFR